MKKLSIQLIAVCAATLIVGSAQAEIVANTITLTTGQSYSVPSGKIFAVYHVSRTTSSSVLRMKAPGSSFVDVGLNTISNDGATTTTTVELVKRFFPPLYLQASTQLQASGGALVVSGLVVDPSDLFLAGTPGVYENEIFSVAMMNGNVQGSVRFPTARPVVFDVEASTDLLGDWVEKVDAVITSTGGTDYDFVIADPSEDYEFFRVNVDARRNR